jgi:uncharacterized protein (TIGR00661 family)
MNFEKNNIPARKLRVLIAPLDWGLGHATRCIPIIYELLSLDVEVFIAVEDNIKNLLEKELPEVNFLPLAGYNIRYSRNSIFFQFTLLAQLPKILIAVYAEKKWLKKIIPLHNIDAVISDNRLGLSNATIPCVYITHQLTIKAGNLVMEWLLQKIHYQFINKYSICWVPDFESAANFAGTLSHPKHLPKIPLRYLGLLSRLEKIEVKKKYDLLVLISGPEPQRTVFENILLNELRNFSGKTLFIRGLLASATPLTSENINLEILNYLPSKKLNIAIQQAELVICRSGYSTVMDLIRLQQKAILVPTPGQTEQEYLSDYLSKKKLFFSLPQKKFSLNKLLEQAKHFSLSVAPIVDTQPFKKIVQEFCSSVIK